MASKIQLRRDLSSTWTSSNPVLSQGEPGLETDTQKIKYGDGVNPWNSLSYSAGGSITGPTGPAGTNGTNGATGPSVTGPAGTPGATGPAGTSGSTGPSVTGPAGTNGVDGPTGPAGANGTNGVDGPTGPAGANGVDGPTGPAGIQGPTGATPNTSTFAQVYDRLGAVSDPAIYTGTIGINNTLGITVTLPTAYSNTNYKVQLTYLNAGFTSGNAGFLTFAVTDAQNFVIYSTNGADANNVTWTTFGSGAS
jgi:hypothetical protein